jgi:Icc protein
VAAQFKLPLCDGFLQYATQVGDLRVLVCDTLLAGLVAGSLDEGRLAWLTRMLQETSDPTLLVMHHPPLQTKRRSIDDRGLEPTGVAAVRALIAQAPHVVGVLAGHIHKAIFTAVAGRPLVVAPSVHLPTAFARDDLNALAFIEQTPTLVIHEIVEGALISHLQSTADQIEVFS